MIIKNRFHKNIGLKTVALLLLSLTMVFSILPDTTFAYNYTPKGCFVYGKNEVDLDKVATVEYQCKNNVLTIRYLNAVVKDGADAVYRCSCDQGDKWVKISGGKASFTHDFSNHADSGRIVFWLRDSGDDTWHKAEVNYTLSNGKFGYYSEAGKSEKAFFKKLNAQNPKDYCGLTAVDKRITNLKKMKTTVKKITKGLKKDSDKVKAIHDWICKNIQYDSYSLDLVKSGEKDSYADACAAGSVYASKLGVCTGYAQLTRVFCAYAEIPCVVVYGNTGITHGVKEEEIGKNPHHAWNAIYTDGQWKAYDVTWDSQNKYRGPDSTENVKNKPAIYTYYALDPLDFGKNHFSFYEFGLASDSKIDFEGPEKYEIVDKTNKKIVLSQVRATDEIYKISLEKKTEDIMIKGGPDTYTIVGIGPNAFKDSPKVKKLYLYWNREFTKDSIKDCLKGSKITKVIINSLYCSGMVESYKEWFSDPSIVGKKVKVEIEV